MWKPINDTFVFLVQSVFPLISSNTEAFSIWQKWPVNTWTEFTNFKDKFHASNSNFFKIARTIFALIIFQDFAAPSLQNDSFDLQTGRSGRPTLANGKHT